METKAIFYPLAAQVILTIFVWFYMFYERIGELLRKKAKIEKLANPEYASINMSDSIHSSDNFENLFEMPILFYVAVLSVFSLKWVDEFYIEAAWTFVFFRIAHSFIHCTYNRIHHRFLTYILSSIALWAFWGRLIFQIFTRSA